MTDTNPPTPPPEGTPQPALTSETVHRALKAFKKKLKITRLERESRQIAGPLSKGTSSGIVAITPPAQFPREVWEELVRQKKLIAAGGGTYELVGE
jgi:hypothetical protein